MKKTLIQSYIAGVTDQKHGESYGQIARYALPEFITNLVVYSLPIFLDAYFVGHLRSTPMYSVLGATNNMLHWLIKVAEALSVGTVIMVGTYNGTGDHKGAGRVLRDAFWTTLLLGACFTGVLYVGAHWLYDWYLPKELVSMGVPFLRMKILSVLCMFAFFAFVGFLRGIKNSRAPMKIFIFGSILFVFFDYAFIFGAFGFPEMGLYGSAIASIIQYAAMLLVAIGYVWGNKKNRMYAVSLLEIFTKKNEMKRILQVSWPVMLDKSTMALAYIWLLRMMKPLEGAGIATFSVVKDMERFAFLPAIACAQVITFLVSNDVARGNLHGIKTNIKKIALLASVAVSTLLLIMSVYPRVFIQLFDKKGDFTDLAATVFPMLSLLVFFDVMQLLLSGAMRGSGNVNTVFYTRLAVCFGYFMPVSYIISYWLPIEHVPTKFVLIYGAFYMGNALMSIVYINKFRSGDWKQPAMQGTEHDKNNKRRDSQNSEHVAPGH